MITKLPTIPKTRKRTHSFSALNTFAMICERRYALDRNMPWIDNVNTLRGSQIHAAEEWVGIHYDPTLDIETLLIQAATHYDDKCPESLACKDKTGMLWPLDRATLTKWLLRTCDAWRDLEPLETEFWIRGEIPGCEWPIVGKVDLRAKYKGLETVWDWKSTNNMGKILTPYQASRSIQGRIYSWLTGIRHVAFAFFSQYHDAEVVEVIYTEADIDEIALWVGEEARACEQRWETGGWALAQPTCGLCSEQWCTHWKECVGCVRSVG